MGKLTTTDLKSEWNQLEGEEKQLHVDKAEDNLLRGQFLVTDLYENLRQANGSVT